MGAPDRAASRLEVLVLGTLRVQHGGRPLALPPSRKARALLGYLAVSGRPLARQRLCELLWDSAGDPRGALRWSLSKLRPIVDVAGARLVADKESVSLALRPGELDLFVARRRAGASAAGAIDELRAAAELFRGELLEGLDLPDCIRFHEWCTAQRESARRLRLAILDALAAGLADRPEEALEVARARVAVDPYSEAAHASVIRLLARLGRAREGMEQYDAFRRTLAATFGTRPGAEIERARLSLTAAHASAPAAATPRRTALVHTAPLLPLVGRAPERAALARALEAATAERSRHVLLVFGDPGIGKTRLLDELAALATRGGGTVLRGRAFEAEGPRSYGPWIDALREAPLSRLSDVEREELAPLLPELGRGGASVEQAQPFDAMTRAVRTLADFALVVLIVDDVHWLDHASAAMLHYAARALDDAPVLVACAARPGELAENAPALLTLRALARMQRVTRLVLEPLPAEDAEALARMVDPSLDAARVVAESRGNPLVALTVARALRSGGNPWAAAEALFRDRLDALSDRARELAEWAAVYGRACDADRLAVTGLSTSEILSALAELERHGVLRPDAEDSWDFTHDLFRQAAYTSLPEPRRRALHRQVARWLAALPDRRGALAGEIAYHAITGAGARIDAHGPATAGVRAAHFVAPGRTSGIAGRGSLDPRTP